MPHELFWIPIMTISLAISLGGLGALIRRIWKSEKDPTSYKIACTALVVTAMFVIIWILWDFNQLLLKALF